MKGENNMSEYKSKSYKQFLKDKCSDKDSLIKESQYKKQRPQEYACYHDVYDKAVQKALYLRNAGHLKGNLLDPDTLMQISKQMCPNDIPYPEMSFEDSQKKVAQDKADRERLRR